MAQLLRFLVILLAALVLLSFAAIQPSLAQSNLPSWTEIAQQGTIPRPLWDGASAYHDGQWYIFGGLERHLSQ